MPSATVQATIEAVEPFAIANGSAAGETEVAAMFAAIDAAGFAVVQKSSSSPVASIDAAAGSMAAVTGIPRTFVCGARLGASGWMLWVRTIDKDGGVVDSPPVFRAGNHADLLA